VVLAYSTGPCGSQLKGAFCRTAKELQGIFVERAKCFCQGIPIGFKGGIPLVRGILGVDEHDQGMHVQRWVEKNLRRPGIYAKPHLISPTFFAQGTTLTFKQVQKGESPSRICGGALKSRIQ
jgi:hypothetical protein